MRSTFFGIELARRSLAAQQQALDITGQNIANVNTPGYSRQEAIMQATDAYTVYGGSLPFSVGTGVEISRINRMRDHFLDLQMRNELSALGYWQSRETAMEQVEVIFNEPSDAGLQRVMNEFWSAWQDVGNNPEDLAARQVLAQRAQNLTISMQNLDERLQDLSESLYIETKTRVNEVNLLAEQIAALNGLITKSEATGNTPNDLLDKRDLLVEKLAMLVPVRISQAENAGSEFRVSVDGSPLVEGPTTHPLDVEQDASGAAVVVWREFGFSPNVSSGKLAALMEMQNVQIVKYRQSLSDLAVTMATVVNGLHQSGYALDGSTTGLDFFGTVTDADGYVRLSFPTTLADDPNLIAAAANPAQPGDGDNALAIADALMANQASLGANMSEFYRAMIGEIGVDTAGASQHVTNQELLTLQIENQRQSVSGVSLDEEMTRMLQYQQAYQAAARMVEVVNSMLDTLINRMVR